MPILAAAVLLAAAPFAAGQEIPATPQFDPGAVERGKQLLVNQCGFCHGSNARGGSSGPDLIRSALVQDDENGKQLGAFLKVGRPERKMPKFDLPDDAVSDLATFFHSTIASVTDRENYKILNILVGDPKAGRAFFNGAGKCSACHSIAGDLKGVGAKYEDAAVLQGRLVMPRGVGWPQPGQKYTPPFLEKTAVTATVKPPSGPSFTGPLILLTDFELIAYDAAAKRPRTWLRNDGIPAVTLTDPLQGHVDLLRRWTDTDIHNMTAFLATLK